MATDRELAEARAAYQQYLAQQGQSNEQDDIKEAKAAYQQYLAAQQEPEKKEDGFWRGLGGTLAAAGDIIGGIPKVGVASAAALIGKGVAKVQGRDLNIKELYDAANEELNTRFPPIGKALGVDDTLGYKAPMYPFEKLGEAQEWVAGKIPDKDVAGATVIASNFMPIPLAKPVGKAIAKGTAAIDPTLRNIERDAKAKAVRMRAEEIAKGPEPTQMTPEELVFWKQRAEQMQKEAQQAEAPPPVLRAQQRDPMNPDPVAGTPEQMEALARTQQDVLRNQVPEDGVIPRTGPDGGVLPRGPGQRWAVDENGIPVRYGISHPESFVEGTTTDKVMGILQDEPARNDLGNAIQEANGPQLSPIIGDHLPAEVGSQSLRGPLGAPEIIPLGEGSGGVPKTIKNRRKQGGGVDVQAILDGLFGTKTKDPVNDFRKSLLGEVQDKVRRNKLAVEQLETVGFWQYKEGDKVYSSKEGKTYTITGRTIVGSKSPQPSYFYEWKDNYGNYQKGTFNADRLHDSETMSPVSQPRGGKQSGAIDVSVLGDFWDRARRTLGKAGSVLKDKDGQGVVVFRGSHTSDHDPAQGRETYAAFSSENPYLASDFGLSSVTPFVFRPDVKIIEFPTNPRGGFDKFAFDERAKRLGKNEVLVVRGQNDSGPASGWDAPYHRGSRHAGDQYAWKDPSVVKPAYDVLQGQTLEPSLNPKPYADKFHEVIEHNIRELENGGTPVQRESISGESLSEYNLMANDGHIYKQQYTEAARHRALDNERRAFEQSQARVRGNKQRGVVDPDLFTMGVGSKIKSVIEKHRSKTKEDVLRKHPGLSPAVRASMIVKGPTGEKMLENQAKIGYDGVDINLWENWQSGPGLTRFKAPASAILGGFADWMHYVTASAAKFRRDTIIPFEKSAIEIKRLGKGQYEAMSEVLKVAQQNRRRFTPDELGQMGLDPKAQKFIDDFFKQQDAMYEATNARRKALGMSEMSREEAHVSSMYSGDFELIGRDKDGRVVWASGLSSKAERGYARRYLQKKFGNEIKWEERELSQFSKMPRDVLSAYHQIIKYFGDDPKANEIKAALEDFLEKEGINARGQQLHQQDKKANVRGYEGDKPWRSARANADDLLKAQFRQMEEAARWANVQDMMIEMKKVMSDEKIQQTQPEIMKFIKASLMHELGMVPKHMQKMEKGMMNSLGLSHAHARMLSGFVKGVTYTKHIAFSAGYMLATPFQAVPNAAMWYAHLHNKGLVKTDVPEFVANMLDGFVSGAFMTEPLRPKSKLRNQWALDNDIFTRELFDHYSDLSGNPVWNMAKSLTNLSISRADQALRVPIFHSFADAIERGGKLKGEEAWKLAGQITENTMVSLLKEDRPLAVSKGGLLAEQAYVYKSPIMNFINTSNVAVREARKGNVTPLIAMMTVGLAITGVQNMPGVSDVVAIQEYIKDHIAENEPDVYVKIKDKDLRRTIATVLYEYMPEPMAEIAGWGLPSAAMNLQLGTRLSQSVGTLVPPSVSAFSDVLSGARSFSKGTEQDMAQGARKMLPPTPAGFLETHMDTFKSVQQPPEGSGLTNYRNPNDVSDPNIHVQRTEADEVKKMLGLSSMDEHKQVQERVHAKSENRRQVIAGAKLLEKWFRAKVNGNDADKYLDAYLELNPDAAAFETFLQKRSLEMRLTPEQQQVLKANTVREFQAYQSRQERKKVFNMKK